MGKMPRSQLILFSWQWLPTLAWHCLASRGASEHQHVCAVHAILDEATMPATHYEKFLEALVQEEPEMTVRRLHGRGSDVRGSGSMGSSEECVFFAMLKCSPSCHGQ